MEHFSSHICETKSRFQPRKPQFSALKMQSQRPANSLAAHPELSRCALHTQLLRGAKSKYH